MVFAAHEDDAAHKIPSILISVKGLQFPVSESRNPPARLLAGRMSHRSAGANQAWTFRRLFWRYPSTKTAGAEIAPAVY